MALGNILTIAGILLLLVAIFAFGVVSLQCCFNACHRRCAQQAAASSQSAALWRRGGGTAAVGGGDPELLLLRSLPATVYRAAPRSNDEEEHAVECVVCLAGLEDGEVARFLPCCNHGFHAQCVDTWLASQSTCPLCRINVVVARPGMAAAPAVLALPPVAPEPANYRPPTTCPRRHGSAVLGDREH